MDASSSPVLSVGPRVVSLHTKSGKLSLCPCPLLSSHRAADVNLKAVERFRDILNDAEQHRLSHTTR